MDGNPPWGDPREVADHIRLRPGMHLGGTGTDGLHRLADALVE